jgi:predicted NAD/FAD-binding protein
MAPIIKASIGKQDTMSVPSSSTAPAPARQRVVIVGSGCAGLSALYTLARHGADAVDVTLVEASARLGGHAYTIRSPAGPNGEAPEAIDVGFMVMNRETYPNLLRIFGEIGARTEDSDMSLAVR